MTEENLLELEALPWLDEEKEEPEDTLLEWDEAELELLEWALPKLAELEWEEDDPREEEETPQTEELLVEEADLKLEPEEVSWVTGYR